MIAAKLANMPHGGGMYSSKNDRSKDTSISQAKAAELLNVSEPLVKRARSVREHGTPELVRAVERDEVTVGSAAKLAKLPAPEQRRALGDPAHVAGVTIVGGSCNRVALTPWRADAVGYEAGSASLCGPAKPYRDGGCRPPGGTRILTREVANHEETNFNRAGR
ncbi:MAG: hypothetical protein AB1716_23740 [Planctomycetota bacterium]